MSDQYTVRLDEDMEHLISREVQVFLTTPPYWHKICQVQDGTITVKRGPYYIVIDSQKRDIRAKFIRIDGREKPEYYLILTLSD